MAFVLKRRNNLKSRVFGLLPSQVNDYLALAEKISSCESLNHLSIHMDGAFLTDAFLSVIANSRSYLTSLTFGGDNDDTNIVYTMTGFSAVICAFRRLTKLHICIPSVQLGTQDKEMSQLVAFLTCLKHVALDSVTPLCATLFSLLRSCPLLEYIRMLSLHIDSYNEVPQPINKNYTVKEILLSRGQEPDYLLATTSKSVCPSLQA